jgi:FkbM family methyltransferase
VISHRSRALNTVANAASRVLLKAGRALRGENLDDHRINGEARLLRALAGALGPRPVIFDVGANVGAWSAHAAQRFPGADLHAFEPHPGAFAQLEQTLRPLGVACHRLALGAEPGHATLHFDPGKTVLSSLHQRDLQAFGLALDASVDVEVARLDDLCDELGLATVDLLKIDVEGHERDVLAGAERRLASGAIGVVQFEYGGTYLDAGVRLRDVLDRFPSGYALHRIVPWGLMPVSDRDLREESFTLSNFVAVGPVHTNARLG